MTESTIPETVIEGSNAPVVQEPKVEVVMSAPQKEEVITREGLFALPPRQNHFVTCRRIVTEVQTIDVNHNQVNVSLEAFSGNLFVKDMDDQGNVIHMHVL